MKAKVTSKNPQAGRAKRKTTGKRTAIPSLIETNVLENSGRRCCLCVGINNDFAEKLGQIAHLDHDRTNNSEENLAWLCLFHHSPYDSTTRQHKNYTIGEVKRYRGKLYERIRALKEGRVGNSLAFVELVTDGALSVANSYNVLSVSDNGIGDYTVTFAGSGPGDERVYCESVGYDAQGFPDRAVGWGISG
jgi:hypothetical protein